MAKTHYKLSSILIGHELDVRAVATFADGTIVSASRDKTARVWRSSQNGKEYNQVQILTGHKNFVSSVCVLNPTEQNAPGFIITGSNDNNICVYINGQDQPIQTIKAHQNTVSNLNAGKEAGTFLSSSWDFTAKLWNVNDLSRPQLILTGHENAVWCTIDLPNGLIITGSADKLIIVWARNGSIKHKLTGHKDCVRDIATINETEFISCANDSTVRHWDSVRGTCLGEYHGHEHYIYSISAALHGKYVVTSGEDGTIRVWDNGHMEDVIFLPSQSIWCVNILPNGDIVSGDSDGFIRIFSANPQRHADANVQEVFDKEVEHFKLKQQEYIGDINVKDLPDSKALLQPGQRDGQTKMINEGGTVKAYNWSQNEQKWILIGDVMNASTAKKQLYNGIEYDYVFSIDVQDGVPPLKLPYNTGEDPWHVAQKFIHDNGLSQLYLDQVANFIVKNSKSAPILNPSVQYADPFTGGNRYIPQSKTPENVAVESTQCSSSSNSSVTTSYIPHTKYLKLEQANLSAILDKLCEFNSKQDAAVSLPKEKLEVAVKLAGDDALDAIKTGAVDILMTLLTWSDSTVFPALDIARLAVLRGKGNDEICSSDILNIVRKHTKPEAIPSNQMLTFRLLANMFCHEKGEKLLLENRDELLKALLELKTLASKNNQVAITTFMLNLTVALNKYNDIPGRTRALNVLFTLLPLLNEQEALFRALVALGTLLTGTLDPEDRNELITSVRQCESVVVILRREIESSNGSCSNKLSKCFKEIIDLIL